MKNVIHIDLSWKRIMRTVEEQANYYAAKSGDIDITYINGLLTEPDKYHLRIYMREALNDFEVIAEEYPHEILEGEIEMSMPMNFDEVRTETLRSTLWQFISNHILRNWMAYIGKKSPEYVEKEYKDEYEDMKRKLRAILNHRKRLSKAHFEDKFHGSHKSACVIVQ